MTAHRELPIPPLGLPEAAAQARFEAPASGQS